MAKDENESLGAFGKLFNKNVPHILESIFLSLDYDSFMTCHDVCCAWAYLFKSDSFKDGAEKLLAEKMWRQHKLYTSVESGNIEEVNYLLSIGVDPSCRTLVEYWNSGITPLNQAAIQLLLEAGCEPKAPNVNGFTPLHKSVMMGAKDAVKSLLDAGANPNTSLLDKTAPLHSAAELGYVEITKLLLDAGADPKRANDTGMTPLIYAAWCHNTELVKLLVGAGSNPNDKCNNGLTALHAIAHPSSPGTAEQDKTEVAKLLLKSGADPNAMCNDKSTPLLWASLDGCKHTVKLLLKAGSDPNIATTDKYQMVPLHAAAYEGHTDVVKLLLDAGAHPNSTDGIGWTPLTWAINNWNKELIEILFKAGRANREK